MKQFLFAAAAADAAPTTPAAPTPPPAAAPAPAPASAPATPAPATTPAATDATTVSAAPATTTETGTVQPTGDQKQQKSRSLFEGPWPMILIIFAIFYFMMIKPQQRKEKERRKTIETLRAGQRVIFAGGLIGTIVEAKEATFKIEIAGDVVIEVARSSVQGLAIDDKPASAEEPAKK